MSGEVASFHWADYVVFSLSLAMGVVIGVAYWIKGNHQKSTEEYLLGGRNMNVVTVGASMLASSMNAVFLLGGTAEVSYRGAIYLLLGVSYFFITLIAVFIYAPLWRRIKVTSAHEYLERRFNSMFLRAWAAGLFSFRVILFLSIVFYTPAMALSQVTGLNLHIAIVVCGLVCALYTVLGGLKAVVLVDTIQAFLMLLGMLVLAIMGSIRAGGAAYVLDTADDLGRINFNNFSVDPRERHTVWTFLVGFTITWSLGYLSDQVIVQRYMAVKNTASAQWAVVIMQVIAGSTLLLVVAVGLIAAVYYQDCDPLLDEKISAGDQLLPYFFMDLLGPYHGLPGIFIASIFAAALSTVSSSVNSLSAVFLMDFLKPLMIHVGKPMPVHQEHIYAKVLTGIFSIVAIAFSYLAPLLGQSIISIPPTLTGAIGGPLYSVFFLGFFVPWSNKWGAFGGSAIGLAVSLWVSLGAVLHGAPLQNLPVGTCNITDDPVTATMSMISTFSPEEEDASPLGGLYNVSYVWLGSISVICSVVAGLIISAIANACGYGDPPGSYDAELLWSHSSTSCCRSPSDGAAPADAKETMAGFVNAELKRLDHNSKPLISDVASSESSRSSRAAAGQAKDPDSSHSMASPALSSDFQTHTSGSSSRDSNAPTHDPNSEVLNGAPTSFKPCNNPIVLKPKFCDYKSANSENACSIPMNYNGLENQRTVEEGGAKISARNPAYEMGYNDPGSATRL